MSRNPLSDLGSLGDYLREQRQSAELSLRQLSELAGVSNPYLSQIERGLKRPSAEILQQLAKGLEVSAETLYVKAGILDEHPAHPARMSDVRLAIAADPHLTARQKSTMLDVYESFVGIAEQAAAAEGTSSAAPSSRGRAARTRGRSTSTTGRTTSTTGAARRRTSSSTSRTTSAEASGSTTEGSARAAGSRRRRPTDPTT
jgi:transcriptional regulator with XRE-family HTH domain